MLGAKAGMDWIFGWKAMSHNLTSDLRKVIFSVKVKESLESFVFQTHPSPDEPTVAYSYPFAENFPLLIQDVSA